MYNAALRVVYVMHFLQKAPPEQQETTCSSSGEATVPARAPMSTQPVERALYRCRLQASSLHAIRMWHARERRKRANLPA
jgi:hypothetical protein